MLCSDSARWDWANWWAASTAGLLNPCVSSLVTGTLNAVYWGATSTIVTSLRAGFCFAFCSWCGDWSMRVTFWGFTFFTTPSVQNPVPPPTSTTWHHTGNDLLPGGFYQQQLYRQACLGGQSVPAKKHLACRRDGDSRSWLLSLRRETSKHRISVLTLRLGSESSATERASSRMSSVQCPGLTAMQSTWIFWQGG